MRKCGQIYRGLFQKQNKSRMADNDEEDGAGVEGYSGERRLSDSLRRLMSRNLPEAPCLPLESIHEDRCRSFRMAASSSGELSGDDWRERTAALTLSPRQSSPLSVDSLNDEELEEEDPLMATVRVPRGHTFLSFALQQAEQDARSDSDVANSEELSEKSFELTEQVFEFCASLLEARLPVLVRAILADIKAGNKGFGKFKGLGLEGSVRQHHQEPSNRQSINQHFVQTSLNRPRHDEEAHAIRTLKGDVSAEANHTKSDDVLLGNAHHAHRESCNLDAQDRTHTHVDSRHRRPIPEGEHSSCRTPDTKNNDAQLDTLTRTGTEARSAGAGSLPSDLRSTEDMETMVEGLKLHLGAEAVSRRMKNQEMLGVSATMNRNFKINLTRSICVAHILFRLHVCETTLYAVAEDILAFTGR